MIFLPKQGHGRPCFFYSLLKASYLPCKKHTVQMGLMAAGGGGIRGRSAEGHGRGEVEEGGQSQALVKARKALVKAEAEMVG